MDPLPLFNLLYGEQEYVLFDHGLLSASCEWLGLKVDTLSKVQNVRHLLLGETEFLTRKREEVASAAAASVGEEGEQPHALVL